MGRKGCQGAFTWHKVKALYSLVYIALLLPLSSCLSSWGGVFLFWQEWVMTSIVVSDGGGNVVEYVTVMEETQQVVVVCLAQAARPITYSGWVLICGSNKPSMGWPGTSSTSVPARSNNKKIWSQSWSKDHRTPSSLSRKHYFSMSLTWPG